MPLPFQIPNQSGYLPQLPQRPDDTDTSQADEQVYPAQRTDLSQQEQMQVLMRAFMDRLNAQPPAAPPAPNIGGFYGTFLSKLSGPVQQVMLQRMMQQQPGAQQYQQQATQYEAGQKQLGDIQQMMGGMQRADVAGNRMEMYRFIPGQLNYLDPVKGNVSLPVWRDRATLGFVDDSGNPVQLPQGGLNMPMHFTPYSGPGGETAFAPTSPQPGTTPQVPQTGQPGSPTMGVQGGQAQNVAPAGAAGKNIRTLPPRQAPLGATQDVARASAFVQALAPVFNAWKEAKQQVGGVTGTGIAGTAGQLAVDRAAQTQGMRAFLPFAVGHEPAQAAINYKQKQKIALYNYVKQQTGAQFSVTEMDRYESMFPRIEDTEQTAISSLSNLAQKAVNDINAMKANWHALQTPQGVIYVQPEYMEEFLRTGGISQEVEPTDPAESILMRHLEKKRATGQ